MHRVAVIYYSVDNVSDLQQYLGYPELEYL
jgi:hypothetical protein